MFLWGWTWDRLHRYYLGYLGKVQSLRINQDQRNQNFWKKCLRICLSPSTLVVLRYTEVSEVSFSLDIKSVNVIYQHSFSVCVVGVWGSRFQLVTALSLVAYIGTKHGGKISLDYQGFFKNDFNYLVSLCTLFKSSNQVIFPLTHIGLSYLVFLNLR